MYLMTSLKPLHRQLVLQWHRPLTALSTFCQRENPTIVCPASIGHWWNIVVQFSTVPCKIYVTRAEHSKFSRYYCWPLVHIQRTAWIFLHSFCSRTATFSPLPMDALLIQLYSLWNVDNHGVTMQFIKLHLFPWAKHELVILFYQL